MATITVLVSRLVSEENHSNFRVGCTLSDEVESWKNAETVRRDLHCQCRDHVRAVIEARRLQVEQEQMLARAKDFRRQAEQNLAHAEKNAGMEWADELRERGKKGLVEAEATKRSAETIEFDKDWLPF